MLGIFIEQIIQRYLIVDISSRIHVSSFLRWNSFFQIFSYESIINETKQQF